MVLRFENCFVLESWHPSKTCANEAEMWALRRKEEEFSERFLVRMLHCIMELAVNDKTRNEHICLTVAITGITKKLWNACLGMTQTGVAERTLTISSANLRQKHFDVRVIDDRRRDERMWCKDVMQPQCRTRWKGKNHTTDSSILCLCNSEMRSHGSKRLV
jgi:hypothetical protein